MPNGPLKDALRKVAVGRPIDDHERDMIEEYVRKIEEDPERYASERMAATLLHAALDPRDPHAHR